MPITTLSSHDFDLDAGRARRTADTGPVIITDGNRPAHVLLNFDEYRRLTGQRPTFLEMMGSPPGVEDVEFEIERSRELRHPSGSQQTIVDLIGLTEEEDAELDIPARRDMARAADFD